jgi:hypothetical protein
MAAPADTSTLSRSQTALAGRVLAEAVGDLARQGHKGKDLTERATGLATSLVAGLSQLTSSTSTSCSTQSASREHQ